MKKVVIVRGLPGCGKSTYVEKLVAGCPKGTVSRVCSADQYFWSGGRYAYDLARLPQAHQACMSRFLFALRAFGLRAKDGLVVVDNTSVRRWEWENYLYAAEMAGWKTEVHEFRIETVAQVQACFRRCVHGVPLEVIARMAVEFEPCLAAKVVEMEGA
jgi:predicted kinase